MSEAKPERKLLRLEVRNSEVPIERKPEWIRTTAKMGPEYQKLQSLVKEKELHTVCQEAGCPNISSAGKTEKQHFSLVAASARGAAISVKLTPENRRRLTQMNLDALEVQ